MNRLEKKCLVTVSAAHGLLVVILFVGPAFFVSSHPNSNNQPITVFSSGDITMAMSSGQRVESAPANPLPPPPTPTVEPPKEAQKPIDVPPPPKNNLKPPAKDLDVEKPTKPTLRGDDPVLVTKKKKREVTITDDELKPNTKADQTAAQKKAADDARKRAQAQAAAEARQRAELAKEFGDGVTSLDKNLSGKTAVTIHPGGGESGPAAVNYYQLVQSILDKAWHPSDALGEDTPNVTISIVISRDGTLRGHISKRSGNSLMDKSVQNVLDTVTSVEPFPADFSAQQLPATFTFNIKAKR